MRSVRDPLGNGGSKDEGLSLWHDPETPSFIATFLLHQLTALLRPFIVARMGLDEHLFLAINGLAGDSSELDWVMAELARPSNLYYPVALVAAYWVWWNWRECLIGVAALAALIGLTDSLGTQVKKAVQRPRPCVVMQHITELLGCGSAYSFPSNHAMNTAAAASFFQVLYPRSGWISWPLVAVIGISRVYIGAHYPSDVVGGWMMGAAIGASVAWILRRRLRFGRGKELARSIGWDRNRTRCD